MLEVMPGDLRVNSWLVIPAGELHERFSRSSGPGGQSVNTTDSRVELSFDVLRSPALPERERSRALAARLRPPRSWRPPLERWTWQPLLMRSLVPQRAARP